MQIDRILHRMLGMLLALVMLVGMVPVSHAVEGGEGLDTLTVKNKIGDNYMQVNEDGTLSTTDIKLPGEVSAVFSNIEFCFILYRVEEVSSEEGTTETVRTPVTNYPYVIGEDSYTTADNGVFTLKKNYMAVFSGLEFTGDVSYEIRLQINNIVWAPPSWVTKGSIPSTTMVPSEDINTSAALSIAGDPTVAEKMEFTCTNYYLYNPYISGDPISVVMDYGKSMDVNVLSEAQFQGLTSKEFSTATLKGAVVSKHNGLSYGTAGVVDTDGDGKMETVRFTPTRLLDHMVEVIAQMEVILANGVPTTVSVPVYFTPASFVYYESDFTTDASVFNKVAYKDGKSQSDAWKLVDESGTIVEPTTAEVQDDGYTTEYIITEKPGRENIPSNAFFADFEGDASRYSANFIYNGYNFDSPLMCPWASTEGAVTLSPEEGMMEVPVGAEGTTIVTTALQGAMPQESGDYPLRMTVSDELYLQTRFRLDGCTATGEADIRLTIYYDAEGVFASKEVLVTPFDSSIDGLFQSCTADLSEWILADATEIRGFALEFEGISGGKITVDYLFLGPRLGFDMQVVSGNSLYFDFTNNGIDDVRYSAPQYGGYDNHWHALYNYDAASSKVPQHLAPYGEATLQIDGGLLRIDPKGALTESGYGFRMVTNLTDLADPLAFASGEEDMLQIRYRLVNATVEEGVDTYIKVLLRGQLKDGTQDELELRLDIPAQEVMDRGYFSVTLPLWDREDYKGFSLIQGLEMTFHGLQESAGTTAKLDVDYLYIGPEAEEKTAFAETGDLFFGFTNTETDIKRYKLSQYRGTDTSSSEDVNYDKKDYWKADSNTVVNVFHEGCLHFSPTAVAETYGVSTMKGLNYKPEENDYCQVRFRVQHAVAKRSDEKASFVLALSYSDGSISEYSLDFQASEYIDNGFYTLSVPLQNGIHETKALLTGVRPYFRYITSAPGTKAIFSIDYIKIGAPSPERQRSLPEGDAYFSGFTNTAADIHRFSSNQYNHNMDIAKSWRAEDSAVYSHKVENGVLSMELKDGKGISKNRIGFRSDNETTAPDGEKFTRALRVYADQDYYCQFRIKLENVISNKAATDPQAGMLMIELDLDTSRWGTNKYEVARYYRYIHVADYVDRGYFTITAKLTEDPSFYLNEYLNLLHPRIDWVSNSSKNAKISMDYIYVGPMTQAPIPEECLYFGFDNLEEDRDRYTDKPYNDRNFDSETELHWSNGMGTGEGLEIDNMSGNLMVTELTNDGTVIVENGQTAPLTYRPDYAQVTKLRFKLKDLKPVGNATISLLYDAGEGWETALDSYPVDSFYFENDYYLTTIRPLAEELRRETNVSAIRLVLENVERADPNVPGQLILDQIYIGPAEHIEEPVYGYDSTYLDDSLLSNGSSYFVEGLGYKSGTNTENYTEVSFTFKGTGFDLISRTGPQQATLNIWVTKADGTEVKSVILNNKGELELYQIPVFSLQGLEYDTYTVRIAARRKVVSDYEFLNRGGEFYFDGVRIYDPLNTAGGDNTVALGYHKIHKEGQPYIKEVRNILLSQSEYAALEGTLDGAVFVDMERTTEAPAVPPVDENGEPIPTESVDPDISVTDHININVHTYNKVGPKNEVYLDPEQGLAFRLSMADSAAVVSFDIGAKTIGGQHANLAVGIVTADGLQGGRPTVENKLYVNLHSSTTQYYPLDIADLSGEGSYLIIYNDSPHEKDEGNAANGVISITDIKIVYDPSQGTPGDLPGDPDIWPEAAGYGTAKRAPGEAPVRLLVDGNATLAAEALVKEILSQPALHCGAVLRHSLNLANDISINYLLDKTIAEGYEDLYLECVLPLYDRSTKVGERTVTLYPEDKNGFYYFTFEGLTAVEMNSEIRATLYMTREGRQYYSPTDIYSIATYANNQIGRAANPEKLKAVCAELLRYGALAQLYKGYRVSARSDSAMTEEAVALLSDLETVTFQRIEGIAEDLEAPAVLWKGKALDMNTRVGLRYVVDVRGYDGDPTALSLHLSYTDSKGEERQVILEDPVEYVPGSGWYTFMYEGLYASELRCTLQAAVYAGEERVSQTLTYSPQTYAENKAETLGALCRAMFAYSDSARTYFEG